MNVVRFPPRIEAVLILPEPLRGVYLVAREHGWVFAHDERPYSRAAFAIILDGQRRERPCSRCELVGPHLGLPIIPSLGAAATRIVALSHGSDAAPYSAASVALIGTTLPAVGGSQ